MDTLATVIFQMEEFQKKFSKNKSLHSLVPFLKTYYFVTTRVQERREEFKDPKALDSLDLYFARRYFIPLNAFLQKQRKQSPWKEVFRYSEKEHTIPLLSVLIGINTHINADLCISLKECKYSQRKDFALINEILLEVLPQLMEYLYLEEHDFFGMAGLIFEDFFRHEFKQTIVKWRNDAWKNAQKIKSKEDKKALYQKVEAMNRELIDLFEHKEHYLFPLQFLERLHSLQIKI